MKNLPYGSEKIVEMKDHKMREEIRDVKEGNVRGR
jgi:hypothetical protein